MVSWASLRTCCATGPDRAVVGDGDGLLPDALPVEPRIHEDEALRLRRQRRSRLILDLIEVLQLCARRDESFRRIRANKYLGLHGQRGGKLQVVVTQSSLAQDPEAEGNGRDLAGGLGFDAEDNAVGEAALGAGRDQADAGAGLGRRRVRRRGERQEKR